MKLRPLIAIVPAAAIFLCGSYCWATGLFTPTEPGEKTFVELQRKPVEQEEPVGATFGLGAYSSNMKFENDDAKMTQNHLYVHMGYAWSGDFETYLRVGAADMKFGDATSDHNGFLTIGGAKTLYNSGRFSFGPMANYSRYFNHTLKENGVAVAEITGLWDLNIGMSFAVRPNAWVKVQATPFLYFTRGDSEVGTVTTPIREKSNYGIAATARVYPIHWITDSVTVDLESLYKAGVSYGCQINYHY